jgi:glycosyltransferase involved in cell wall biosynthesis
MSKEPGAEPTVLHLAPTIGKADGISTATLNMILSFQRHGLRAGLLTASYPGQPLHVAVAHLDHTTVLPARGPRPPAQYPFGFSGRLADLGRQFDLVHIHGLWRYPTLVGGRILERLRIPYVVSPHGLLMPEARGRHSFQKSIALGLSEARMLRRAALIMADGARESEALRSFDPNLRSVVVPLAVDTDVFQPSDAHRITGARRRELLSVSRLHPIKRLVELVCAFGQVAGRHPDWDLLLAGPEDDSGYRRQIEEAASSFGLSSRVRLLGRLEGAALIARYQAADVFVLPSTSESSGLSLVEAMATGVPVIATTGTPWEQIATERSGWWVDPGIDALALALEEAIAATTERRREMGSNGRRLAMREFSLDALRLRLVEAYREAIEKTRRGAG